KGAMDGLTRIERQTSGIVAIVVIAYCAVQIPTSRYCFADRIRSRYQFLIVGCSRVGQTEVGVTAAARIEIKALRITAWNCDLVNNDVSALGIGEGAGDGLARAQVNGI